MNTNRLIFLVSMLIAASLSACGPSQAELDATSTKVAADTFATQTAQAPTSTPTSTPSPTPTVTPTATATPTPTPTITPTPAPPLLEAALTLDDLPPGFQAIPPEVLGGVQSNFPPNTVTFMFGDAQGLQFLFGFLIPYSSRAEQLAFDKMMPQLCETLAAGFGAESGLEMLTDLEDIGETRAGCTSVTSMGAVDTRFDTVLFRQGEIAEIVVMGYPDGDQPGVSIDDLARLLDQRVSDLLGLEP